MSSPTGVGGGGTIDCLFPGILSSPRLPIAQWEETGPWEPLPDTQLTIDRPSAGSHSCYKVKTVFLGLSPCLLAPLPRHFLRQGGGNIIVLLGLSAQLSLILRTLSRHERLYSPPRCRETSLIKAEKSIHL